MIKTFIVATDQIDSHGDIIKLDGIKIPEKVMVTKDFDRDKPLGFADVKIDEGKVVATAEIPNELINAFPAIGFQVVKSHREGDVRFLDEIKLHYIGLSENPNVDESVKRISDQSISS